MSTDAVLVVQPVFAAFRNTILSIIQDPQSTPEITTLITTKAADCVRHLIADSVAKGAIAHTLSGSSNLSAANMNGDPVV